MRYGDELLLVDELGRVFNTAVRGVTSYLTTRPRGEKGEARVQLLRHGGGGGNPSARSVVRYGDSNVSLAILCNDGPRRSRKPLPATNFRKPVPRAVFLHASSGGVRGGGNRSHQPISRRRPGVR